MHVLVKYKLFKEHARRNNKDNINQFVSPEKKFVFCEKTILCATYINFCLQTGGQKSVYGGTASGHLDARFVGRPVSLSSC